MAQSGKQARVPGLFLAPPPPLTFARWQKGLCDEWFASNTHFVENIVRRKIVMPDHIPDTMSVRALAIFMKYGTACSYPKCAECRVKTKLVTCRDQSFRWMCTASGKKHAHPAVNAHGFLVHIRPGSWMAFLNFINSLRLGKSFREIALEIVAGWGNINEKTMRHWKAIYQTQLGIALADLGGMVVGTGGTTVVFDETVVGVHKEDGWSFESRGISKKGAKQKRAGWQGRTTKVMITKGVLKRYPARTVYKTQEVQASSPVLVLKRPSSVASTVLKRPSGAFMEKPSSNLKNTGRWRVLAVEVGKGTTIYTHDAKTKRVTYRLLPRAADAKEGMPRGLEEVKDTLEACVSKKAFVVHDGWTSSVEAVKQLGYKSAPPVKHEDGYRDKATGFHTNDAESENARLKKWNRHRYGQLQLNANEMNEYIFYINIGDSMSAVLGGLAVSNGGAVVNRVLA